MTTKNLYLIIGKSGAGKTTVSEAVAKKLGLKTVSSFTTRPARYPGETGHIFISKEEFDKKTMVAYTMFNGNEYGVTEELLDECQLYVIDPAGVRTLRERYRNRPLKAVYLDVSEASLKARMKARGDSDDAIVARIRNDEKMFPAEDIKTYDCIINADTDVDLVTAMLGHYILECERD